MKLNLSSHFDQDAIMHRPVALVGCQVCIVCILGSLQVKCCQLVKRLLAGLLESSTWQNYIYQWLPTWVKGHIRRAESIHKVRRAPSIMDKTDFSEIAWKYLVWYSSGNISGRKWDLAGLLVSVLLLFDTANAESNNGITSTLKVKGQN